MWCSAGEEKREEGKRKKERKEGKGKDVKWKDMLYYIKKRKMGGYLYEFYCHRNFFVMYGMWLCVIYIFTITIFTRYIRCYSDITHSKIVTHFNIMM